MRLRLLGALVVERLILAPCRRSDLLTECHDKNRVMGQYDAEADLRLRWWQIIHATFAVELKQSFLVVVVVVVVCVCVVGQCVCVCVCVCGGGGDGEAGGGVRCVIYGPANQKLKGDF